MEEFGGYGDVVETADAFRLDPVAVAARAARLNVFQRQLTSAQQLVTLVKENNAGSGHVKKLERLLSSIIGVLEEDRVPDESIESNTSSCLQQLLQSELVLQLCEACLPNSPIGTRRLLIKTLGTLLRQVRERVLILGILKPLNLTITTVCLQKQSQLQEDEEYLHVVLLNELCSRFTSDNRLVPLFFDESLVKSKSNTKGDTFVFPVFSSLIRFMHEPGPTGLLARDTLLMCVGKLPHAHPGIDDFVVESSNFCQMLVAGLSAFYAGLPTQIKNCKGEKRLNIDSMPQLQTFLDYLEFCDAVTLCTSDAITLKLVQLVNSEFASPILRPALLQTTAAEALAATLYLDLILARITHSTLATPFVDLILDTSHERVTAYEEYMLKVLLGRILRDDKAEGELCLATIRLFITLFNLNREDVFEHLCIKPLLDIPQVSLSLVSPDHVDSDVVAIHAARSFLELRCALFESTPDGPDFTDLVSQARIDVNKRHKACAHWTKQYSITDLKVAAEQKSSKQNPGSPHRTNWSPSKAGSLRLAGEYTGLWGVLMEKLRHINSHKLKTNLLLTQLIATLVQFASPLWASFTFTLNISKAHANVATLYGVLSQLSYEADNIEQTQVAFQAELKSARDSAHSSRSIVPSVIDPNKRMAESNGANTVPKPAREPAVSSTALTTTTTTTTATAPISGGYFSSWRQTINKIGLPQPITSPTKSLQTLSLAFASQISAGTGVGSLQLDTSLPKEKQVKPKLKTVNGVLIFEEFLKELSAIALEHALLSPLLD
eukprot:m.206175 g.206175  ORF g.206175 m.206175 type:complete len:778 (-) comp32945_c1_seq2:49-2382(-)